MTALPPDPDPTNTPNIAGGVEPGETPPESAQTSATPNKDPIARRKFTPAAIASFVVIALFVALFVAAGALLILRMFGAFG